MIGAFLFCFILAIFVFAVVYGNIHDSSEKKPPQSEKRNDIDTLFGGGPR